MSTTATPRPARPDLPSWFPGSTTALFAVGTGLALAFAALAVLTGLTANGHGPLIVLVQLLGVLEAALVLSVGAWCYTVAGTRRVDPTTPQLDREWLLIAWFIPVAHVLLPHRMFGDLWASAKWQQSDRRGSNTPLAPRPWVISAWAWVWGSLFVWDLIAFFVGEVDATSLAVHLALSALSTLLLCGVVRAIAMELGATARPGSVS